MPVLKGKMPWGPGNIAKVGKVISKVPGFKIFKTKPRKNLDKVKGDKGTVYGIILKLLNRSMKVQKYRNHLN